MKIWSNIALAITAGLFGLVVGAHGLQGAEIKILSTNAVTEVMADLVPEFERATGHKVVATYEPTSAIVARIKQGETADAVILIKQAVEELKGMGKVVAGTQADLAKTSLALAVRAGAPKPDIGTVEAFKQAMLNAKSIASPEVGASGLHLQRVFERLGIAEQMKPKIKLVKGAAPTGELVTRGEAEMAVHMMSELLPVAGIDIVGPFPGDLHFEIVVTGAVSPATKDPAAAEALIKFLASPAAAAVLKKRGMERA